MHVLSVTDYLGNVGGAELSTQTILNGLESHEAIDEVSVIGVDLPRVERLNFPNVDVIPVKPPEFIETLPEFFADVLIERLLARAVRKHIGQADIIHAHHRRSALAIAQVNASIPVLTTIRDYWPICPISIYHVEDEICTGCDNKLDECVEYQEWDGVLEPGVKAYLQAKRRHHRPVLGSTDCAIFIANHLRERLKNEVSFPSRTEVIYNPVSVNDAIEPTCFADPTLITASSLTETKGVGTAVRALGKLNDLLDVRLIVKGDGPQRHYLESLANEVAPNAIEFHGRVPPEEVYRDMAGATATIFPSLWEEPFGRITVESMMLGTPVIGSDVGGIGEIITDGETGLLFPAGNANELAERIRLIVENGVTRRKLTTAASRATNRFRPEHIVQEHVALYESLATTRQP